MLVKRLYKEDLDGTKVCVGVEVKRWGAVQHFTPRLIERAQNEGWMRRDKDRIILITKDGEPDVVYRILRTPGKYCCHCQALIEGGSAPVELPDGRKLTPGQQHVEACAPDEPSPDQQYPHGYRWDEFYVCALEKGA